MPVITTLDTWYKYYPMRFNHAVAGLSNDTVAIFQLVLNEIAISDNRLKDDDRIVSSLIRQSLRLYRRVKRDLIALGKLYVEDGYLRNPKCDDVLGERRIAMERRSEEQRERAKRRWDIQAQRNGTAPRTNAPTTRPTSLHEVMDSTGNISLANLRMFNRIDENRGVSSASNALKSNGTGMQKEMQQTSLPAHIKLEPEDEEFLAQKAKAISQLKRMMEMRETAERMAAGVRAKTKETENRGFSQAPKSLKVNETGMQNQNKTIESYPLTPKESSSDTMESLINSKDRANFDSDHEKLHDTDSGAYAHMAGRGCADAHVDSEVKQVLDTPRYMGENADGDWAAAKGRELEEKRRALIRAFKEQEADRKEDHVHAAVHILRSLMERCGVDEARCFWTSLKVQEWMMAGVDESTIFRVVDDVLRQARRGNPEFVPQSLKYFDRAMEAVMSRRVA